MSKMIFVVFSFSLVTYSYIWAVNNMSYSERNDLVDEVAKSMLNR